MKEIESMIGTANVLEETMIGIVDAREAMTMRSSTTGIEYDEEEVLVVVEMEQPVVVEVERAKESSLIPEVAVGSVIMIAIGREKRRESEETETVNENASMQTMIVTENEIVNATVRVASVVLGEIKTLLGLLPDSKVAVNWREPVCMSGIGIWTMICQRKVVRHYNATT